MDSNELGNTLQSAYKGGNSTETALLCIHTEIHMSLSNSMPIAQVLLDLLATFDTIDQDTRLTCLSKRLCFAWTVLRWFISYLLDHFLSVKICSVISDRLKVLF